MDRYRGELGVGLLALAGASWIAALTLIGTTRGNEWTDGIPLAFFGGGFACLLAGAMVLGWIYWPWSLPVDAEFTTTDSWLGIRVAPRRTLPDTTLQLLTPKSMGRVVRAEEGKDVRGVKPIDSEEQLIPGVPYQLWGEPQMHFPGRVQRRLEFRIGTRPGVYPVKLRLVADELRKPADFRCDVAISISEDHIRLDERERGTLLGHLRNMRRDLSWNKMVLKKAMANARYWSSTKEGPTDVLWSQARTLIERLHRCEELIEPVSAAHTSVRNIATKVAISGLQGERTVASDGMERAIVLILYALLLIERAEAREQSRPSLTVGSIPSREHI